MRVLIADKFEQSGRDRLAAIGCEVLYQPGTKDEALVQAISQSLPDVLVVRSTKVTENMLVSGALKLVVRAGAGYNTIDVATASRRARSKRSSRAVWWVTPWLCWWPAIR